MTLKTSIAVNMAGNLTAKAKQYSRAISGMSDRSSRSLRKLRGESMRTSRAVSSLGNRFAGAVTGAAIAMQAKQLMDLQNRWTRLGIQANISREATSRLKGEVFDLARAPDIRVDPGEITSAIEAIVEKTGDLQFAQQNIRNIGLAIQATGSSGGAIGEILAEFQKMGVTAPKEVLKALDTMNVQGKEGAFTLENLAALGPRVITAYTSMGRTGTGALKEMGAALQVIRMGTGSSEMAATAFEATLRTLGDRTKVMKLKGKGIQVFDVEALKQGKEVLRPINELMVDIITKTAGKKTALSGIFDAEAMRAFNAAASEFQRTGAVTSLEKFMSVHADGSTTIKDSARAADDASQAIENLSTAWSKIADQSAMPVIQFLADGLNQIADGWYGDKIYELFNGGQNARDNASFEKTIAEMRARNHGSTAGNSQQQVGGKLEISVSDDRVRVTKMQQQGNMALEVDTGAMLAGG